LIKWCTLKNKSFWASEEKNRAQRFFRDMKNPQRIFRGSKTFKDFREEPLGVAYLCPMKNRQKTFFMNKSELQKNGERIVQIKSLLDCALYPLRRVIGS
jgi:hypothetical protein